MTPPTEFPPNLNFGAFVWGVGLPSDNCLVSDDVIFLGGVFGCIHDVANDVAAWQICQLALGDPIQWHVHKLPVFCLPHDFNFGAFVWGVGLPIDNPFVSSDVIFLGGAFGRIHDVADDVAARQQLPMNARRRILGSSTASQTVDKRRKQHADACTREGIGRDKLVNCVRGHVS